MSYVLFLHALLSHCLSLCLSLFFSLDADDADDDADADDAYVSDAAHDEGDGQVMPSAPSDDHAPPYRH